MFAKTKTYALLQIILLLFFITQFAHLKEHTQSFRFGDESEHLTPGWMVANYGTRLYVEISTNHQPMPIIASLLFFKTVNYPNLFMLIERIRQLMLAISFLGALVLVFKFRWIGLITVLLVETVAFWLFGYHMLAESLTLYPTILIMGITTKLLFWKSPQKITFFDKIEPIIFGLCVFIIAFSLLPSIPFLLLASFIYLSQVKLRDKKLMLLSICVPIILLFMFVDVRAWFQDTIIDNMKYFLPYETETKDFKYYIAILIYPFQSLFNHSVPVAKYYLLMALLFVISQIPILANSKKYAIFPKVILLYLLVMLLNLRIPRIDVGFYSAFHLLPHLGAFTILTVLLLKVAIEKIGNKFRQKIAFLSLCGLLLSAALFINTAWWRESTDKMEEHFIQYGEIQSLSSAFKVLKQEGDKLLVGELEGLLNITSELPIAGSQNAYLNWSFRSEESRSKLTDLMVNNPPTFIYFPEGGPYFGLLKPYLESEYTRIQRYDGAPTNAYMLNSTTHKRSEKQWKEFESLFYRIPQEANL